MNIVLYQKVRNDIVYKKGIKAIKKGDITYDFLEDSWDICKLSLSQSSLKDDLLRRAMKGNEDLINDEILELMEPYIKLTQEG